MWTVDTRCSQCKHKPECPDRAEILKTLAPLAAKLSTEKPFVDGPGDGILIMACKDFAVA